MTVIIFIIVLSLLVFAHEWGHFFSARRLGIKAEEFGFGFPPRVIGIYRDKSGKWHKVKGNKSIDTLPEQPAGTVYSINALPLGGFVRIKGENGDNLESDSFAAKPLWKRAIVLCAGVFMNIILAAVLFSFGYMIGMPQSLGGDMPHARVDEPRVAVLEVLEGSAAAEAGLEANDIIISVENDFPTTEAALQGIVAAAPEGEALTLEIRRGTEQLSFEIAPRYNEEIGRKSLGVAITATGTVQYPFFWAIYYGFRDTILTLWAIVLAFAGLIASIFTGGNLAGQLAGPVGIAQITGEAARLGFTHLISLTLILSLNLAVLNILPFPALDGGRLLFLVIERIKGSPVKRETEAVIHNIGFLILMLLVVFVTYKDIVKLF